MQWKKQRPTKLDYKFTKRFAWFPTKMVDKDTIVWLECYYEFRISYIDHSISPLKYAWERRCTKLTEDMLISGEQGNLVKERFLNSKFAKTSKR